MAGTDPEVRDFVAPADGELRVSDGDSEHARIALNEGETITLAWEAE